MKGVRKEYKTARMGMVLEEVGRPKCACSRLVLRSVDRAGLASGGSHGDWRLAAFPRRSLEVLRVSRPFSALQVVTRFLTALASNPVSDIFHQLALEQVEAWWNSAGTAKMLLPVSKLCTGSKCGMRMVFIWIHLEDNVATSVNTPAPTARTYSLAAPILSKVASAMKEVSKECETARMGMVLEEAPPAQVLMPSTRFAQRGQGWACLWRITGYRRHSLEVLSGSLRVSLTFMFGCKSVHEVADGHHQTLFHPPFATWLSSGWNSEASWNSAGTAKKLLPASKMYTGSKLGTAEQWNSEVAGFFSLSVKINLVYHVGDIK